MNKKITLQSKGIAKLEDKEPFYLPENKLTFEFDCGNFDLLHAFISLKNGNKSGVYSFAKKFTVPQEFLEEGLLEVLIYAVKNNIRVNSWNLFPLRIIYPSPPENTYGKKIIFDYISSLEKRIVALEEKQPKNIF